jgi:hypothetical protein
MTIWQLTSPTPLQDFAVAGMRGTWRPAKNPCKQCTRLTELGPPLVVEWEVGSAVIGDFTWTGVTIPVVTEQVLDALRAHFNGFAGGPVEMIQHPKLRPPVRPTKRTRPRVWLPYTGPRLFTLELTTWVHMDRERTTARLVRRCDSCGDERYELSGFEKVDYRVEVRQQPPAYEMVYTRVPRAAGQGLFLRADDLGGADVFGVYEFDGWTFCNDRAKEFIEEQRYTNVDFWEMGEYL